MRYRDIHDCDAHPNPLSTFFERRKRISERVSFFHVLVRMYSSCFILFYDSIITITFEPLYELYWYFHSEVVHVFYDRERFIYSEIDDDEVLKSEFYCRMEYQEVCPVCHRYTDKVYHHFIQSRHHFSTRYTMITKCDCESHDKIEDKKNEESTYRDIESSYHEFQRYHEK